MAISSRIASRDIWSKRFSSWIIRSQCSEATAGIIATGLAKAGDIRAGKASTHMIMLTTHRAVAIGTGLPKAGTHRAGKAITQVGLRAFGKRLGAKAGVMRLGLLGMRLVAKATVIRPGHQVLGRAEGAKAGAIRLGQPILGGLAKARARSTCRSASVPARAAAITSGVWAARTQERTAVPSETVDVSSSRMT